MPHGCIVIKKANMRYTNVDYYVQNNTISLTIRGMNLGFLPIKQPTLYQLAKSVRPRTPQTIYNAPINPEIFVLNGKLLRYPLSNVDFLSNYQIFSDIASGSYGYTLLARDLNGQTLAIKKLTNHIRQHIQEGKFLSELASATIPKIHSCFVQNNFLYIVEEAGEINLEELLSYYVRLPEAIIWAIAADCLNAIQCCYSHQMAHLDIKPSNVLVFKSDYFQRKSTEVESSRELVNQTPDCMNFSNAGMLAASSLHFSYFGYFGYSYSHGQGYIMDPLYKLHIQMSYLADKALFMMIDFGNAQKAPFKTDTSCGDARYLHKDFLQTSMPSFKCDLFSLGVMLFECLTGVVPATSGDLFERLRVPGGIFDVYEFGDGLRCRFQAGDALISLIVELMYGELDVNAIIERWESSFGPRSYAQVVSFRTYNERVVQVSGATTGLSARKRQIAIQKLRHIQRTQLTLPLFIRSGANLPLCRLKSSPPWCARIRFVKPKPAVQLYRLNYFAENSDSEDAQMRHFFPPAEGEMKNADFCFDSNELNFARLDAGVLAESDVFVGAKAAFLTSKSCSELLGFYPIKNSPQRLQVDALQSHAAPAHQDVTSEITYADGAKLQQKSAYDDQSVILSAGKETLALSTENSTNSYIENDSANDAGQASSSSCSILNIQYQPFNKTVEFFLSSLEFFSGIASMIYVQPLKRYHPTPTTVLSASAGNECNEENSDSDLNRQRIKASFRPSSGSLRILSQSELISQGYQSINNGYVDCFEKKNQNNWFLQKLHHHRLVMFLAVNSLYIGMRLKQRSTCEKAMYGLIILVYAVILYRLNKHNLELNYDTKYLSIHYTNIYVDPIKAKSCFMGFMVPVLFTLQNCVQFDYTQRRRVWISLGIFAIQLGVIGILGVF